MRPLLLLALVLGACAADDQPGADARTCVVAASGGGSSDRVTSSLEAVGRPITTAWERNGSILGSWTYAYDDAGRLISQQGRDDLLTIVHSATSAVLTRGTVGGQGGETETYTFDAADRVIRIESATYSSIYQLGADGRIDRTDESGSDPETGDFTRSTENTYDADGRPSSRHVIDSRGSASTTVGWIYQTSPGQLVAQRTGDATHVRYIYSYDAAGRTTRAEENDGISDWIVDVEYAADGAVTTRGTRDGMAGNSYAFSAGCAFSVTAPGAPSSGGRPGPQWQFQLPSLPSAYE